MNRMLLLCLSALPLSLVAQPDAVPCWNPDADGDELIGATDLLDLLRAWGDWEAPDCLPDAPAAAALPLSAEACSGLDHIDFQGYRYPVLAAGDRCWFAENLRSSAFANGDFLVGNLSSADWLSTFDGATAVYGEGESRVYSGSEDAAANLVAYGRLYNWHAVDDPRGLCPAGWHVPTDGEWRELEQGAAADSSFRVVYAGGRNYGGFFGSAERAALWWSSTAVGNRALFHRRDAGNPAWISGTNSRNMGASVRCVKTARP